MPKKEKKTQNQEDKKQSFSFVYGEMVKIPEEKQSELVKKYKKEINDFLSARSTKETEWQNNAYILSNQRAPKSKPWAGCSNVALGMAAEKTDTLSETMMSRTKASQRDYNLAGLDDYSKEHQEDVEAWLNYQLDTPQEFNDIDTFIRALAKDDCATMTIGMEREEVKVKKW